MIKNKRQTGFTLLEILITVLILSIGLLGLAGLQVSGMKSNHNAYLHSQATILGYDISDRMRANPGGTYAATAVYTVDTSVNPYTVSAPATTANCSNTTGCTPAQMTNTDINQWRVDLAEQLPGGMGVICIDSDLTDINPTPATAAADCDNVGTSIAIKIWWNDARVAAGTLKLITMNYQP